jgi:hypothetical protein
MIYATAQEPVELRSEVSEEVWPEASITTPAQDVHQHRASEVMDVARCPLSRPAPRPHELPGTVFPLLVPTANVLIPYRGRRLRGPRSPSAVVPASTS